MEAYYIFDNEGEVLAIFKDKEFALDYLYYLEADEDNCKIGILNKSVFAFEEHDATYHLKDPRIYNHIHKECKRFRAVDEDLGYCFYTDEQVKPYDICCTTIEMIK